MKEFDSLQRKEIRGRVMGIIIKAGAFYPLDCIPSDFVMEVVINCPDTQDISDEDDRDSCVRMYYISSIFGEPRTPRIEVGREYNFEVYPFEGYNFLLNYYDAK
jgi:hypothetical protein